MIIKRNIEEVADALMTLRIDNQNSEFYKRYKESGKCMYEFAIEWLQEESS